MPRRPKSPMSGGELYTKIATGLVLPILGGFFLGNYLDERFGTSPWLTLILIIFGVVSGFTWLYKSLKDSDE